MEYDFWISPHFRKQIKALTKKYRHLKKDVVKTLKAFDKRLNIHLGKGVYKVRVKSTDLQRGKSKSFRLIIFVLEKEMLLLPLAIYFKGEKETMDKNEINYHIAAVVEELNYKETIDAEKN